MAKYASAILVASPPSFCSSYGRIEHKKLTHLGIGQVADGFADVQDGILKIFGPHHRLAITPFHIPKLVDVVTNRECLDIVVRKQDAAAAGNLLGREV